MLILTSDNESYETDLASSDVGDIRYCVLDLSVPKDTDFYFLPLVFLESFNSPAVIMKIGKHTISLPYDWYILIGEPETGDLEIVKIEDFNDRDFLTPTLNPLSDFIPKYQKVEIVDTYNEVRWFFPKLAMNNILAIPLAAGKNPPCMFCINEVSGKKLDQIPAEVLYK